MSWAPTLATMEPFVKEVVERFGLGPRRHVALRAMTGSTNRLWRFDRGAESFVVKELMYSPAEKIERRRRAAAFEGAVFASGAVTMPEPVPEKGGELVVDLVGSRGAPCLVRVHRWMDGTTPAAVGAAQAAEAGRVLAMIHEHGRTWSTQPKGTLRRWWDQDPMAVVERLGGSPLADVAATAAALIRSANDVIDDAESTAGDWVYSHADHKPQNSLVVGGTIAVLDWDECGHCHPRLEAVESALRWAVEAEDPADAFRAFLVGHGGVADVHERDFGKWVAAVVGWFGFQARRTLGDWPTETAYELREGEAMARDAVVELERTLRSLSRWAAWA